MILMDDWKMQVLTSSSSMWENSIQFNFKSVFYDVHNTKLRNEIDANPHTHWLFKLERLLRVHSSVVYSNLIMLQTQTIHNTLFTLLRDKRVSRMQVKPKRRLCSFNLSFIEIAAKPK